MNRMKNLITLILQILKDSYIELQEIKNLLNQKNTTQSPELLNKPQVMDLLGISDTTYRRYVRAGRLKPMRLHGIDMYQREDLLQELRESRRKGRI